MITLTTQTAFRILIDLGLQGQQRVIPLVEMHRRIGGSQTYLAKVTAALTRARIVRSSRGSQGGLALAKAPSEIRLLDVVAATQGMPTGAFCSDSPEQGITLCGYHVVMADLHRAIVQTLESKTLADLLARPCGILASGKEHGDCCMVAKKI